MRPACAPPPKARAKGARWSSTPPTRSSAGVLASGFALRCHWCGRLETASGDAALRRFAHEALLEDAVGIVKRYAEGEGCRPTATREKAQVADLHDVQAARCA